jgi:hypothetical protein
MGFAKCYSSSVPEFDMPIVPFLLVSVGSMVILNANHLETSLSFEHVVHWLNNIIPIIYMFQHAKRNLINLLGPIFLPPSRHT